MPPKTLYHKDDILNAAFLLVQSEGVLNARSIAKQLGCSTHPIYLAYESMQEIEADITKMIQEYAIQSILDYKDDINDFLAIGMGYLHFCRKEPFLFAYLIRSEQQNGSFDLMNILFERVYPQLSQINFIQSIGKDSFYQLFHDLWIYAQGLNRMASVDSKKYSLSYCRQALDRAGKCFSLPLNTQAAANRTPSQQYENYVPDKELK